MPSTAAGYSWPPPTSPAPTNSSCPATTASSPAPPPGKSCATSKTAAPTPSPCASSKACGLPKCAASSTKPPTSATTPHLGATANSLPPSPPMLISSIPKAASSPTAMKSTTTAAICKSTALPTAACKASYNPPGATVPAICRIRTPTSCSPWPASSKKKPPTKKTVPTWPLCSSTASTKACACKPTPP